MSSITPPAPADRLALIIEGLCHAVARRGGSRIGCGGLAGALIVLVWSRLRRITARFARYAISPPVPSRPAAKRQAPSPGRSQPRPILPRNRAWLLRLVPEVASGASQLRHFLADPEVAALLAEAPHLRRTLRPLCHMLGIQAASVRATQPLNPPASPTPDAAPSLPIPPQPAAPQAAAPAAWPPRLPFGAPPALA